MRRPTVGENKNVVTNDQRKPRRPARTAPVKTTAAANTTNKSTERATSTPWWVWALLVITLLTLAGVIYLIIAHKPVVQTVVTDKVVQQTVVVKETVVVEKIVENVIATPLPATATPMPVLTEGDGSSWTPNCSVLTAPSGGQIFWSNHRVSGKNNDPYAVVYDPKQGGSADHPALGWYYQPCLPAAPDRKAHEVALVLRPGNYRFTGPECRVWHNWDGNHPWEQGTLLINRQNILSINIPGTRGTNPAESWVAVKCTASAASGFSFEKLP